MAELYQLQEQEIPDAMLKLNESHTNLKKVADYCEGFYLQATDKKPALEETRGYTTQALASVAYQINTLATSFLSLLDLQSRQLGEMESSINHLSQTVAIHKEKVARREIGVLTTNKSFPRPVGVKSPGIIFPEMAEKAVKYIRKPLDYTLLDTVGCGGPKTAVSRKRESVGSHSSRTPSTTSSAPESTVRFGGPVATPKVPNHYMSTEQMRNNMQQPTAQANPIYGYTQRLQDIPPPVPPPEIPNGLAQNGGAMNSPASPPPPPMPVPSNAGYRASQEMPPPPPEDPRSSAFPVYSDSESVDDGDSIRNSFPPPFPEQDDQPDVPRDVDPPWAPQSYMEKVVALYDYEPQNEDELRLRENVVLYVVKKNSDGWWEGVMESENGQPVCGLFPDNYVEPLL